VVEEDRYRSERGGSRSLAEDTSLAKRNRCGRV